MYKCVAAIKNADNIKILESKKAFEKMEKCDFESIIQRVENSCKQFEKDLV